MTWTQPAYSKSQVDAAGRILAAGAGSREELDFALEVLSNWRAAHSFPLNSIQMGLRTKATGVFGRALIAQRLKRVPSIVDKLRRLPSMRLSRMQDLGGCRAVVDTPSQVRRLAHSWTASRTKHALATYKDYIDSPKQSGYRGIHLVYRYISEKNIQFNGLLIEVQLRSRLQHAWATAVETVGTFINQSLKSSEGPNAWLQFFALAGSAFAFIERTPLVPNTPGDHADTINQLSDMAARLRVFDTLSAYSTTLKIIEKEVTEGSYFFILALQLDERELSVHAFPRNQLELATVNYLHIEQEQAGVAGAQAVLVAADSIRSLKRSYPNYFLDTEVFATQLQRVLRRE